MIAINTALCTGCGACVEVCPQGAIYLVDNIATADPALCRECERCVAACPVAAIHLTTQPDVSGVTPVRAMTPGPERETIRLDVRTTPEPLRTKLLPAMGAALVWAGRELVPRLTEYLLYRLDIKVMEQRASSVSEQASSTSRSQTGGGGRGGDRRRHRHRGGS